MSFLFVSGNDLFVNVLMPRKTAFTLIVLTAQVLIYAHFWFGADLHTTDFPAFHSVGLLSRSGQQPYSLENQCRAQREVNASQECLPFAHPPILLPALSATSTLNYQTAYWRWAAITTFLLVLCALPLHLLTRSYENTGQSLLFFPAIFGLWMGQDNSLVLLAVLMCFWLLKCNKDFLAGFALAFGAVKPQLILLLGIALLFSRLRAFLGFAAAGCLLVLFSIALVGVDGLKGIADLTLLMSKVRGFGVWPEGMYNLGGILSRSGFNPQWSWITFLLGLAFVPIVWRTKGVNQATFSVAIIVTLFTAPHIHLWDLSLLVIPLFTLHRLAALVGSLVIVASFPYGFTYAAVYLLMAGLAAAHMMSFRARPTSQPRAHLTPKRMEA